MFTPCKIYIEPEKWRFGTRCSFSIGWFLGSISILCRGVVPFFPAYIYIQCTWYEHVHICTFLDTSDSPPFFLLRDSPAFPGHLWTKTNFQEGLGRCQRWSWGDLRTAFDQGGFSCRQGGGKNKGVTAGPVVCFLGVFFMVDLIHPGLWKQRDFSLEMVGFFGVPKRGWLIPKDLVKHRKSRWLQLPMGR